jgi:hypothetical protein
MSNAVKKALDAVAARRSRDHGRCDAECSTDNSMVCKPMSFLMRLCLYLFVRANALPLTRTATHLPIPDCEAKQSAAQSKDLCRKGLECMNSFISSQLGQTVVCAMFLFALYHLLPWSLPEPVTICRGSSARLCIAPTCKNHRTTLEPHSFSCHNDR